MNGIMRKKLREIQQTSPLSGWIRLSTDGAAKVEVGVAGCGGILRNDNGVWMGSFSKFLGNTTTYIWWKETWGLYEGGMANNFGDNKIVSASSFRGTC
jgi:hypothetical protein